MAVNEKLVEKLASLSSNELEKVLEALKYSHDPGSQNLLYIFTYLSGFRQNIFVYFFYP